ncbi:hypothetical protein CJ671_10260 [Aliarcobacter cryaerophilus]|uniref:N-acetyltransferase n=1 Tax=Aliarcobacter cryaerophilus TaxID=28198 RepID=A0A2S9SKX8_9BACT|nr:hypothetical protein [Aliarcobacter cryaerophilus]PRM87251.1 hypothetical protein CJ671_10260 [Aliarcobacter cryaerophilus]
MKSQNSKTITIKAINTKQKILDEVYTLLESTYKNVEGGLNFENKYDLLQNTSIWKVIYFENHIIGVLIYKAKHGLKMVACAINETYKNIAKKRLINIFKKNFSKTWMEISEGLERFILKISTSKKFIITNKKAKVILEKSIQLCSDKLHYIREINGVKKTKILIGTPNI